MKNDLTTTIRHCDDLAWSEGRSNL